MFKFEDLTNLSDRSIQKVLKETDSSELSMALKLCSEELKHKILMNMSKRAVEMIQKEVEALGPVRLTDVEKAHQIIIDIVLRLGLDSEPDEVTS